MKRKITIESKEEVRESESEREEKRAAFRHRRTKFQFYTLDELCTMRHKK